MSKLARNTTYYTAALTFQKVLAFVYFTFMARILGPEEIGQYVTALSFTTLFTVMVDVGLSPYLIREVAKGKEGTKKLLEKVLSMKIPLAILSYAVIILAARILDYSDMLTQLIMVAGIIMILDSFSLTFWSTLRGKQNMKPESKNVLIFQLLLVSLGGYFLYRGFGAFELMFALLAASGFQFAYSFLQARKVCGKLKLLSPGGLYTKVLRITLPFALAGIFTRVYTSFDTVMISKMIGEQAVGWYSIPIKVTLAFQFIPMAFIAGLYPAMSQAFAKNKDRLEGLFGQAVRYLALIGFPLGLGIAALAEPLIMAIWGDAFAESVVPLRIMVAGLIVLFVSFPLGSLLNASNRQMTNTKNVGVMLAVNVVLNLAFIPMLGITGAAIASVIASVVLLVLNTRAARRVTDLGIHKRLVELGKIAIASLLMAIVAIFASDSLAMAVLSAIAVYTITVFAFGIVTKQDLTALRALLWKNKS